MIFRGSGVVLPDRIVRGASLAVEDGLIVELGTDIAGGAGEVIDFGDALIAPGFIDGHVHGALGRDAMEASNEAWEAICAFHASGGTTSLALTTVSASREEIGRVLDLAKTFCGGTSGARMIGIHIEGPYFSRAKPGAHRLDQIRDPDPAEYTPWLEGKTAVTQMTLAPELPGALPLISALHDRNIIASGGHSDAWDEEAEAAFVHGMRQVTHTWNCMSVARRRGPYRVAGLLEWALSEPDVTCELIADGRHVAPTLMRMLVQAKGVDRISLVTDATAGAGLVEGTSFRLGEIDCVVRDDVGLTADGTALAGSTATMIRLVKNMVELAGVPLVDAVRMASANPARMLNLEKRGTLQPGNDADFVALSPQLTVLQTWVAGRRVWPASA
jgi:N-acetylglucosamine-6-phosphate deacetylase